jgi:hypothetical protein
MLNQFANWAQIIALPLAIIIAVWSLRRSRQKRALACDFDPIVFPIEIKAGKALEGDIEIHYSGQPVENLFLVRAKLKNTGNIAIRKEHIIEPVTFTFGPDAELLRKPRVLDKRPDNLKIDWDFGEIAPAPRPSAVSLDFDLLNPGDELVAEFTCTGQSKTPRVTARIEGGEIDLLDPEEKRLRRQVSKKVLPLVWVAGFCAMGVVISVVGRTAMNLVTRVTDLSGDQVIVILALYLMLAAPLALILFLGVVLWNIVGPILRLVRYRRRKGKG